MGLDMYAYTTPRPIPDVDFEQLKYDAEIFYWRKHPNLHGWMEQLYRSKGGKEAVFNCVAVKLDLEDLNALEKALRQNTLPSIKGCFFGVSDGSETKGDLDFIHKARDAIANGKSVFYTSWW